MFNWIDMKTQLLTRKVLHGCPRHLTPLALELFRQQSSLSKIDKEEPWTLEIISYWQTLLQHMRLFYIWPSQKSILQIRRKSQVLFVYHVLRSPRVSEFQSPASPHPRVPKSHVPTSPHPTTSSHFKWQPLELKLPGNVTTRLKWIKCVQKQWNSAVARGGARGCPCPPQFFP